MAKKKEKISHSLDIGTEVSLPKLGREYFGVIVGLMSTPEEYIIKTRTVLKKRSSGKLFFYATCRHLNEIVVISPIEDHEILL